jgi:autotransporter-associated beta strand protein
MSILIACSRHRRASPVGSLVLGAVVAASGLMPARAADLTWSGGASGDWNTTSLNWNTNTLAWSNTANSNRGDTAFFPTNTNVTVTLTEDIRVFTSNASKGLNRSQGTGTTTINATGTAKLNLWSGINNPFGGGTTSNIVINAPVVLQANISMGADSGAGATWNGVISGTGGFSGSFSGGTTFLNGLNTFTGDVRLQPTQSGSNVYRVYVNTLDLNANAQSLGTNNTFIWNTLQTTELIYTGNANAVTDKPWRLGFQTDSGGQNMRFLNNGTGTVTWQGAMLLETQNGTGGTQERRLNLGGSNTGDNRWESVLYDQKKITTWTTALTKRDAGKWILSGSNTYTGSTNVLAGTLLINGDQRNATGAITVSANAVFGGDGTIGGNLTLATDARYFFDPLATLTVLGANKQVNLGNLSVAKLTGLTSTVSLGTYTLIDGTGLLDTSLMTNVGETNKASIGNDKFAYFDDVGSSLTLVVVPEPPSLGAAAVLVGGAVAWRRRLRTSGTESPAGRS